MRIVFIGSVEFSLRTLEHLLALKVQVVGVCTAKSNKLNADYADLEPLCCQHDIPCIFVEDINDSNTVAWIKNLQPDVIFCFGWSRLLKRDLLQTARLGVVGYHPTALPQNRGRHPLIWALVLGLRQTASTFFFMDEGADSGDILSQHPVKISPTDDAAALYAKIVKCAKQQIDEFIPLLEAGDYVRVKQDDGRANVWRKRGEPDGRIDWRMSANAIYNLVRALARPYIGADFHYDGRRVKVWRSVVVDVTDNNIEPGKVLFLDQGKPVIKCGDQAICLLETDPELGVAVGEYL